MDKTTDEARTAWLAIPRRERWLLVAWLRDPSFANPALTAAAELLEAISDEARLAQEATPTPGKKFATTHI